MRAVVISLMLVFSASAGQTIQFQTLRQEVIETRLRAVHGKNADREQILREFFQSAGCNGDRFLEQPVKHSKLPNIICTVPGQTDSVIIVGAHFDAVFAGSGIIDNWSGASLLPSFYESITGVPRRHTFVFIGFTEEESGLVGSRYYVNHLSKEEREKISAMVNLDSVGTSSTKIETDRGSATLLNALAAVAGTFKLPLQIVNVHLVGMSDSDAFQDKKIPAINIHSVTRETFPFLHSKRDQLEAIHLNEYYDTYRLVTAYLAYLDEILDRPTAPDAAAAK